MLQTSTKYFRRRQQPSGPAGLPARHIAVTILSHRVTPRGPHRSRPRLHVGEASCKAPNAPASSFALPRLSAREQAPIMHVCDEDLESPPSGQRAPWMTAAGAGHHLRRARKLVTRREQERGGEHSRLGNNTPNGIGRYSTPPSGGHQRQTQTQTQTLQQRTPQNGENGAAAVAVSQSSSPLFPSPPPSSQYAYPNNPPFQMTSSASSSVRAKPPLPNYSIPPPPHPSKPSSSSTRQSPPATSSHPSHPNLPAAPQRTFFDPWNSSSTGHQRAENRLSGSTSWQASRNAKLAEQYRGGLTGGKRRVADTVGAGSEGFGADGRTANGGWVRGARGLRGNGQRSLVEVWGAKKGVGIRGKDGKEEKGQQSPHGPRKKEGDVDIPSRADDFDSRSLSVTPEPTDKPKFPQNFHSLTFYINGCTAPKISDHKLKQLIASHGGQLSISLARRSITHVILGTPAGSRSGGTGGGLAASKIQKEVAKIRGSGGKGVRFVGVEW